MKSYTNRFSIVLVVALLLPGAPWLSADAPKHEWFGTWSMNHDGHVGTLIIQDTKIDCVATSWCDMRISYTDGNGVSHRGRIERLDGRNQHMEFFINFPQNEQKFDAYIFSWETTKMAGTTSWEGSTFGFYASR